MYRSKDKALPDFSQQDGPGGEVFFDVGISSALFWFYGKLTLNFLGKPARQRRDCRALHL